MINFPTQNGGRINKVLDTLRYEESYISTFKCQLVWFVCYFLLLTLCFAIYIKCRRCYANFPSSCVCLHNVYVNLVIYTVSNAKVVFGTPPQTLLNLRSKIKFGN